MALNITGWKVEGERTIVGGDRTLINGLIVGGEIIATVNDKANANLIVEMHNKSEAFEAMYEALEELYWEFENWTSMYEGADLDRLRTNANKALSMARR